MITCKDLRLDYPDGAGIKTVLENVNLEIKKGEKVIFLGPSGSGKSSLIYLLSSLRKPTGGKVLYNNSDFSCINPNDLANLRRAHFGFIFQMHFLIPYLSIVENVMLGKAKQDKLAKEQSIITLEKLGLKDHIHKRLDCISGGQRQRVAIARALVNEPDIIFADEPTASLDHDTALDVMEYLKTYKKDAILIMATHDTSILQGDERIIRFNNRCIE